MDTEDHLLLEAGVPAKKDIVIEHRYVPSVGESVGTLVGMASKDGLFVERQRQMDYTIVSTVPSRRRWPGSRK